MPYSREPRVHPVPMSALRPTQITVGMREVKAKRKAWREHPDRRKADFLGTHVIPVVWGPKEAFYVVDHHHLSLALHQEGVKEVATTVMADLRRLPREAFWIYLDNRGWLHPFDDRGRRRGYDDIPRRIWDLADDPFRSLLQRVSVGGFSASAAQGQVARGGFSAGAGAGVEAGQEPGGGFSARLVRTHRGLRCR
jgi:hypothetical protein